MRNAQIWKWIYVKGIQNFDDMTNLSKEIRTNLAAKFQLSRPEIVTKQISTDGTRKYLLRISGGHEVEAVCFWNVDRFNFVSALNSQ